MRQLVDLKNVYPIPTPVHIILEFKCISAYDISFPIFLAYYKVCIILTKVGVWPLICPPLQNFQQTKDDFSSMVQLLHIPSPQRKCGQVLQMIIHPTIPLRPFSYGQISLSVSAFSLMPLDLHSLCNFLQCLLQEE